MDVLELFNGPERSIRIPDSRTVRLPEPFAKLLDHPDVQRLRRVRQLSSIHLVYPGAVHTRFEHSLGVYGATVDYLTSLMKQRAFSDRVTTNDLGALLAAALLHDIGHYPFAHSLEALHVKRFEAPRHEELAADIIAGDALESFSDSSETGTLGQLIEDQLSVPAGRVSSLVRSGRGEHPSALDRLLASVINSAIDADKLDYLERDSIHMGVPYGLMPDRARLTANLTINAAGDCIALTEKGRVNGEIFLFCRYLMFSEAYWHHTARAASAMIEAALADHVRRERPSAEGFRQLLLKQSDDELLATIAGAAPEGSVTARLLSGLTVDARGLHKRLLTLNRQRDDSDRRRAYDAIYRMSPAELEDLVQRMGRRVSRWAGVDLLEADLLIDTPPRDKDQMDSVPVVFRTHNGLEEVALEDTSTVVRGIALDFVKVVKKIRVFVRPDIRARLVDRLVDVEAALLDEILT